MIVVLRSQHSTRANTPSTGGIAQIVAFSVANHTIIIPNSIFVSIQPTLYRLFLQLRVVAVLRIPRSAICFIILLWNSAMVVRARTFILTAWVNTALYLTQPLTQALKEKTRMKSGMWHFRQKAKVVYPIIPNFKHSVYDYVTEKKE
jgi:hypothetical protein